MKKWYCCETDGITTAIETETPIINLKHGDKSFNSVSGPYDSYRDMLTSCRVHTHLCTMCKGLITLPYVGDVAMALVDSCRCYSCSKWLEFFQKAAIDYRYVVIDGNAYRICSTTVVNPYEKANEGVYNLPLVVEEKYVEFLGHIPIHFNAVDTAKFQ